MVWNIPIHGVGRMTYIEGCLNTFVSSFLTIKLLSSVKDRMIWSISVVTFCPAFSLFLLLQTILSLRYELSCWKPEGMLKAGYARWPPSVLYN